jgi:hypothetical protein
MTSKHVLRETALDLDGDWGVLYVWAPEGELTDGVRETLIRIHRDAGLGRIAWSDPEALIDQYLSRNGLPLPNVRAGRALEEDEMFVLAQQGTRWVAVMSRRWEIAPAEGNPLATALSHHYPVFSVACVQSSGTADYVRYEGGQAIQSLRVGEKSPTPPPTPSLNLDWFRDKESTRLTWYREKTPDDYRSTLQRWLPSPARFIGFLGLSAQGHVNAFEDAPLSDYSPADFLVFRHMPTDH